MECPHLSEFDRLTASSNLKKILTASHDGDSKNSLQTQKHQGRGTRSNRSIQPQIQHQCQVCKSDRSPWMCVACGQVHCGRYVNSHAKKHFLDNSQHFLAICCLSRTAFCYACDDYVMNETQSKRILRALELFQNNQPSPQTNKRKDQPQDDSSFIPSNKNNSKAKLIRLAGIRNLGNTCYMNSVLQCLSHLQRFTSSVGDPPGGKVTLDSPNNSSGHKRKLMQIANLNGNSQPELLIDTLRNTIYLLRMSGKSSIIPDSLFTMIGRNPRFRGYQQQDAHEFLRYVLDRIDKECLENCPQAGETKNNSGINSFNRVRSKSNSKNSRLSIIGNIFGGILQNEVNCLECGFKSHKQDPFMDLSLDIPSTRPSSRKTANTSNNITDATHISSSNSSDNSNMSSSCSSTQPETSNNDEHNKNQATTANLMDCLSSFIELEELTETELYYCSSCQQKQRSTRRFWIRKLPDVLCLHLKRFRYNNFLRTKIDDYIQFPIQGLDMKRFVITNKHETRGSSSGPTTYDLVAFIEHHGSGVGSGHYTAYCRHDGYWFHFDDSSVNACEESTVMKSKAYILFYNRRSS